LALESIHALACLLLFHLSDIVQFHLLGSRENGRHCTNDVV